MKKRNLLVATLIMFALVVSGLTFAWWAGSLTSSYVEDDVTIEVGTGKDVTTEVSLNKNPQTEGTLVPVGRADESSSSNPVEAVYLEYKVKWIEEDGGTQTSGNHSQTGKLTITTSDIQINELATHKDLVNISVVVMVDDEEVLTDITGTKEYTLLNLEFNEEITIKIKVTLTEPSTQAIYNLVAGKNITFDIKFAVEPETTP